MGASIRSPSGDQRQIRTMRDAGWQVRNDYPIKLRCPECRHRQDRETVAA